MYIRIQVCGPRFLLILRGLGAWAPSKEARPTPKIIIKLALRPNYILLLVAYGHCIIVRGSGGPRPPGKESSRPMA